VSLEPILTMTATAPRKPRFSIGDRVQLVGPSVRQGQENTGTVTEVVNTNENVIYRYRVTFPDQTSQTFFGFELELLDDSS